MHADQRVTDRATSEVVPQNLGDCFPLGRSRRNASEHGIGIAKKGWQPLPPVTFVVSCRGRDSTSFRAFATMPAMVDVDPCPDIARDLGNILRQARGQRRLASKRVTGGATSVVPNTKRRTTGESVYQAPNGSRRPAAAVRVRWLDHFPALGSSRVPVPPGSVIHRFVPGEARCQLTRHVGRLLCIAAARPMSGDASRLHIRPAFSCFPPRHRWPWVEGLLPLIAACGEARPEEHAVLVRNAARDSASSEMLNLSPIKQSLRT